MIFSNSALIHNMDGNHSLTANAFYADLPLAQAEDTDRMISKVNFLITNLQHICHGKQLNQ